MRVVIVGGGIAAVYLANNLKKQNSSLDVVILSDEKHPPYNRIHLCRLVDGDSSSDDIALHLNPTVQLELNKKIDKIDKKNKRVFSNNSMFAYDKLIIATGSIPISLFNIENITNATVFRRVDDCEVIKRASKDREVVIVGSGPIGLELLETLNAMPNVSSITLIVRGKHLYNKNLSIDSVEIIENSYKKSGKIKISYEDEIVDKVVQNNEITLLKTKKLEIKNPFLVFGTGVKPNIEPFKDTFRCNRGILTNRYMQTDDKDIYAVGECAEIEDFGFVTGHVKECALEAECAISHILQKEVKEFERRVSTDMLKVAGFDLVDVRSPKCTNKYEKIVIDSKENNRIDEYFLDKGKLVRFIGINSNVDVKHIETLINDAKEIDINSLYNNSLVSNKGKLVCSCKHVHANDLVDIIVKNGVSSFLELGKFSQAGRVCGGCRKTVESIITESQHLIDHSLVRKSDEDSKIEEDILKVNKRIDKFNKLHPRNNLTVDNLESAMESLDIAKKEVNSWVSMVTANMKLHPKFEEVVHKGVKTLNKVPIIWLELADCSGNSEAFIKSTNPAIEDLIFE